MRNPNNKQLSIQRIKKVNILFLTFILLITIALSGCEKEPEPVPPLLTPTPVIIQTPAPIALPTPAPIPTPGPTPTPTPTPPPTPTPTLTPTPAPTPTPTPTPTIRPTPIPTPFPTPLSFKLEKWQVIDSNGRSGLKIFFNTNQSVSLRLLNPEGLATYFINVSRAESAVILYMAGPGNTALAGQYKLLVEWGNVKQEYPFNFKGPNLTITAVIPLWEARTTTYSWQTRYKALTGLKIFVKNSGDLVAYIRASQIDLGAGAFVREVSINGMAVEPGNEVEKFVTLRIDNVQVEENNIALKLKDSAGNLLASYY